jgi:hypothetical protein
MPFKSEAQRREMWANQPEIAKKWAHEFPGKKKLPYHVQKEKAKAIHKGLGGY